MNGLIPPDASILIWSVLLAVTFFGIIGERKRWFGKLSAALVIILVAAVLTSLGILPSAADASISVATYDFVFAYFIPFSIPLLLFNVRLKYIVRETGNLLLPFLIGALGVVLGALLAFWILDFGTDNHKVAGTFIGTYTGGSVNFMAVATALDFVNSPLFASTITVDNVFTNLYILLLFLLPGIQWMATKFEPYQEGDEVLVLKEESDSSIPLLEQLSVSLLVTGLIYVLAQFLAPILATWLGTDIDLGVLLITLFIIVLVNVFPRFFVRYEKVAFDLGMFLMYVFLAVIGASSDLLALFTSVPGILAFAAITLLVHLLISLLGGKLLKVSLKEIMLASCANAGGPSVSAPMAVSFGMKKAVTPAILIGLLGYVIGTFLGVGVGVLLQ